MQVYLVGGAVRDELLGRPVGERDWVVVGATPEQMTDLGFKPVGRDFPVFLHPQTHEEYALARLERKTAPGYRGFQTEFAPHVTLEQDLQRRDLTINAIARSESGVLVDPYGGRQDLEQRWLRHVSPAFVEDPVRILRVARFAARFADLGFRVAPATLELMQQMVGNGEVDALVPERLWRELERALGESTPEQFFDLLQQCGALASVMPEIRWDVPCRAALQRAVQLGGDACVRFAVVTGAAGMAAVRALCQRLRTPVESRELALLTAQHAAAVVAAAAAPTAAAWLQLWEQCDAFRRPERFARLVTVARALATDDAGPWQQLTALLAAVTQVSLSTDERARLTGPALGAALRTRRLEQLRVAGLP